MTVIIKQLCSHLHTQRPTHNIPTYMQTHTCTQTHTDTHRQHTHTHTDTHATYTQTPTYTQTHIHIEHTAGLTHTHEQTHAHVHTKYTDTHTDTHKHTDTQRLQYRGQGSQTDVIIDIIVSYYNIYDVIMSLGFFSTPPRMYCSTAVVPIKGNRHVYS